MQIHQVGSPNPFTNEGDVALCTKSVSHMRMGIVFSMLHKMGFDS